MKPATLDLRLLDSSRGFPVYAGPVELRQDDPAKPPTIAGYASVFDEWTTLFDGESFWSGTRLLIREKVVPGAFDVALADRQDVRALVNHDPSLLLGRTTAGTLRLSVDTRGLFYEVNTPDTQCGRDTCAMLRRGDMTGSSFGFRIRENGDRRTITETDDLTQVDREVLSVDLFDVSPVTYPAYSSTSSAVRSCHLGSFLGEVEEELKARQRRRARTQRGGQRLRLAGAQLEGGFHQ